MEEASLNTWPAPRQVLLDGWVLRFAGGYTRRANSATPLDPGRDDLAAKIAQCESLYAAQGLPALIRTRSFGDAALEEALTARGYRPEGLSAVIWAPLGPPAGDDGDGVELSETAPSVGWLDAHTRITGSDPAARSRILGTVAVPCAFAGIPAGVPGSALASVAFGAVHDGVACLHLVATDPAFRRRGLSRRVGRALLAWAVDRAGAREAALQVEAGNTVAFALYAGLGFRTELFRYQYYRRA